MKMKEVCERTGLTDRAVRLYIESGLIYPEKKSNYTGRSSIFFDEKDIAALETVATLRRAGFSISDIKNMLESPSLIPTIIADHKKELLKEISEKQAVIAALDGIEEKTINDPLTLACILRTSASKVNIPKEDHSMNFKDIERIIKRRITSVISAILMLIGAINLFSLGIDTSFAELSIVPQGGYLKEYNWILNSDVLLAFLPALLLTASAIAAVIYIVHGKLISLKISLALCTASAILLLILPTTISDKMYLFEFMNYRYSFMHSILFENSKGFDVFISALKYLPCLVSALLIIIEIAKSRSDNIV